MRRCGGISILHAFWAKVAPGTVRKAKGDGQLRPEFLKLSQVATENSTPSLRRDDDAVHKMRDGPLLIVA